MAVTLPVVNGSSGTWGTILNAALTDIDTRLTAETTTNGTQDTSIGDLKTRVSAAETSITALQSGGGATYPNRGSLPGSATNGAKATTTDTGLTWTYFNGYWYPPPGSPVASLVQTTTQTIPTNANTVIAFTENRSSSLLLGTTTLGSSAGWTCNAPGWYTVAGGVSFTDATTQASAGYRQAGLLLNGSVMNGSSTAGPANTTNSTTTVGVPTRTVTLFVPNGQKIQVFGQHAQGSSLTTSAAAPFYSTMSVTFNGWYPTS